MHFSILSLGLVLQAATINAFLLPPPHGNYRALQTAGHGPPSKPLHFGGPGPVIQKNIPADNKTRFGALNMGGPGPVILKDFPTATPSPSAVDDDDDRIHAFLSDFLDASIQGSSNDSVATVAAMPPHVTEEPRNATTTLTALNLKLIYIISKLISARNYTSCVTNGTHSSEGQPRKQWVSLCHKTYVRPAFIVTKQNIHHGEGCKTPCDVHVHKPVEHTRKEETEEEQVNTPTPAPTPTPTPKPTNHKGKNQ